MVVVRFTWEVNPPQGVTVMFEVSESPKLKVTALAAPTEKSGGVKVANVNGRVVLWLIPPETPVIVTA